MKRWLMLCPVIVVLCLATRAVSRTQDRPTIARPEAPTSPPTRASAVAPSVAPLPAAAEAPRPAPAAEAPRPRFEALPAFGNTPEGAFARVKLGVMTHDETVLRDATTGLSDPQIEVLKGASTLLLLEVQGCDAGGDEATLHVQAPGENPRDLRAVRIDDAWRIDLARVWGEAVVGRNESAAQAMLKQIVSTEGVWRQTDSDRNDTLDYWTEDVAGFYYVQDAGGNTLKYIDVSMAHADRNGLVRYSEEPATPKNGYWLRVMEWDECSQRYRIGPVGHATNPSKYGFCAWPMEYGVTGTHTFIVNEEGVVYQRDLGPGVQEGCDRWPAADPTMEGWVASE